jgi:hypothetical protein
MSMGRVADRLVAWLFEILCEAIGTCLIMGLIAQMTNRDPFLEPHNPFLAVAGFLVAVPIVLFYFGLTGYLFTTAYAAFKWRGKSKWFYPSAAGLLYVVHSQVLLFGVNGRSEPWDDILISVLGGCMTFGCAAAGNRLIIRRAGSL